MHRYLKTRVGLVVACGALAGASSAAALTIVGTAGDDQIVGSTGNDVIHTRDGEADNVTCGPGRDRALLDNQDVITDATAANANGSCEVVVRADPNGQPEPNAG